MFYPFNCSKCSTDVCLRFFFSPPNFSPWWWSSLSALEAAAAAPAIAICTMYIYVSYIKSRSLATGMHTVNLFGTMDEMFIIIFGLPAWWWFSGFRHRFANYIHQHQQKDYPLILSFFPALSLSLSHSLSLFLAASALAVLLKLTTLSHYVPDGQKKKFLVTAFIFFCYPSSLSLSSLLFFHMFPFKKEEVIHTKITQIAHC